MSNKKFRLKASLSGSSATVLVDIPDIANLDKNIRFSFRDCDTSTYCIRHLSQEEIDRFYKRLGYFEQVTWRQARLMAHEKGFSIEKKKSTNQQMLENMYPQYETFMHFRVNGTSKPFRVFAAVLQDLCCLLLLDKSGRINH